jgi:predicted glycosyltransferase involved in capsule biosynthesis
MPLFIAAANQSPPTEIHVLNYDSRDDLDEYLKSIIDSKPLVEGNFLSCTKIKNKEYFHMAHSRNCAMMSANGEILMAMNADVIVSDNIVSAVRKRFSEINEPFFMCEWEIGCTICLKKEEFIKAGGYDERFEFYGPEDKDLCSRLHRRKLKFERLPGECVNNFSIATSDEDKMKSYSLRKNYTQASYAKAKASKLMGLIYRNNKESEVLVANVGIDWGKYSQ